MEQIVQEQKEPEKKVVGKFKLIMPVADTVNMDHGYYGKDFTRDEYGDMCIDEYKKNDADITNYMNFEWGNDEGIRVIRKGDKVKYRSEDERFLFTECDAYVLNHEWKPYTEEELDEKVNEGKMSVIIIDVEPSTVDGESVSEYKFWQRDSKKVRMDRSLDNKTMMLTLPHRDLVVKVSDKKYARLRKCKIVKDYSDKKRPFNFAMIVERMHYIKVFNSTED